MRGINENQGRMIERDSFGVARTWGVNNALRPIGNQGG